MNNSHKTFLVMFLLAASLVCLPRAFADANAAPVLDSTKSPTLSNINKNAAAPSGAVGTLISSLVDLASPAGQVDNVTDSDPGDLLGIALIAVDSSHMGCSYSINGGTTWNPIITASSGSAILLAADSDNRFYCRPNAGLTGTYASAITFRAWDQTTGTDGGTGDASTGGGTTAFSSASDTASLTVTNTTPGATNLSAAETYVANTPLNLTDIVTSDSDGDSLTATLVLSDPGAGTLNTATSGAVTSTYNAGTGTWIASGALANVNVLLAGLTFTPALNYNSSFTIATSVSDGTASVTGTKSMATSAPANNAPVAVDDEYTVAENSTITPLTVLTNDTDADNDSLIITSVSSTTEPTSSVSISNDTLYVNYTPGTGFCGDDSFTYTADDGNGGTDTATVTIHVTCATPTPPVITSTTSTGGTVSGGGGWSPTPTPTNIPPYNPLGTLSSYFPRKLQWGMHGEDVARLQRFLKVIPADGIFGIKTQGALVTYQRLHGLKADGIAGVKTFASIWAELNK